MTPLSENPEIQTLISLSIHQKIQDAIREVTEIKDPKEALSRLADIIRLVGAARYMKEQLFRDVDSAAWHLALTNLKAAYGLRKMVGVPSRSS